MKYFSRLFWLLLISIQTGTTNASEYNLIVLPDPYCTQVGVEKKLGEPYTLGVIARTNCDSNRPTYGSSNADVDNVFSRILIPLKYSFNGAYRNGFFIQGSAGFENSKFKSRTGSNAEITFFNLLIHGGYQWFFRNGFNVSLLAGIAHLHAIDSSRNISSGESTTVIDFLDKNTSTNTHPGAGIILGWAF